MQSFFFIPGNHPKLIEKINLIKANQIIIDLEDAVEGHFLETYIEKLGQIDSISRFYVRPALFEQGNLNQDIFMKLITIGVRNFMIPKFTSMKDLQEIEKCLKRNDIKKCNFILLIENPKCLFELPFILKKTNLQLQGMAFGSHDFCGETGMSHRLDLLYNPRFTIMSLAKAYNLLAIDIVHTNLSDFEGFLQEVENGYALGFDAKALIHPKQLELLNEFKSTKKEEFQEAILILQEYEKNGKPPIFVYKGKAIEPPHIKFYTNIKNKLSDYGD